MTPIITDSNTSALIMAGARSIALATQVQLYAQLERADPAARAALRALAEAVLNDWGIQIPEPLSSAEAAPESATLIWPPPPAEALLPPVYTENYYHVRHEHIEVALQSFEPMTPREIALSARLRFLGKAVWREEPRHWLMLMVQFGHQDPFWIRSSDLVAGDEIPENER